jgi:hypothetical protein
MTCENSTKSLHFFCLYITSIRPASLDNPEHFVFEIPWPARPAKTPIHIAVRLRLTSGRQLPLRRPAPEEGEKRGQKSGITAMASGRFH